MVDPWVEFDWKNQGNMNDTEKKQNAGEEKEDIIPDIFWQFNFTRIYVDLYLPCNFDSWTSRTPKNSEL